MSSRRARATQRNTISENKTKNKQTKVHISTPRNPALIFDAKFLKERLQIAYVSFLDLAVCNRVFSFSGFPLLCIACCIYCSCCLCLKINYHICSISMWEWAINCLYLYLGFRPFPVQDSYRPCWREHSLRSLANKATHFYLLCAWERNFQMYLDIFEFLYPYSSDNQGDLCLQRFKGWNREGSNS